ncbi:MAG: excinuclease ABC subunit UvrB [Planctomycetes bacterium]|jgi:excinuclease ABC subunit B|nr:excinuclease ABC subunit UvrB [Planctomycetota bacterium]MBT4029736.1 excinuclease ABC subunit UvrB [Planctomycetota bacterium]MBT4561236.1 excinuclease ABC subunit UvrB [Planctomycetota bacterium]MBT7319600.1 excinuclease ABC subunit UvrB [Planctomycetota bacterium]
MSNPFRIQSPFQPSGDQPRAIEELTLAMAEPSARRILLGVTGSGKTFTAAHLVERLQVPTLVLAPNKTLAGQLYTEFRELFPDNAVEYFVSYYDYYQPEAYVPASDTYIEKDARINEQIDRMRNSATAALLSRPDVLVVASVSCIYGLGDPETYSGMALRLAAGSKMRRQELVRGLVRTQHKRGELDFQPGSFRLRGSGVEIWPIHERDRILRVELDGDLIEELLVLDPLTGEILDEPRHYAIWPCGHYIQPEDRIGDAMTAIRDEMLGQVGRMRIAGRDIEAERLERRVLSDLEDLEELGYCSGIENYSRHFEGRATGQPPFTLLNYFPPGFLCVMDECHVTLPQVYGMVKGDAARKSSLIDYGFRLPSAIDNRPLAEPEFEGLMSRVLYVSATPQHREKALAPLAPVEQIVRPTGLIDPVVDLRPATGQVEDALKEAREAIAAGGRVLVTTLTKRSAEDLSEFFQEQSVKTRYLHSDIDTLERAEILRDLRLGVFDVLVGINLLREGLDLPEVSRVLVLDADQQGFLRSTTSLIQTCGRAARHLEGRVIFYRDRETPAILECLNETSRRREIQLAHNLEHGITPTSIVKPVFGALSSATPEEHSDEPFDAPQTAEEYAILIQSKQKEMLQAASDLKFEDAIRLRNEMHRLEALSLEVLT